MISAKDKKIIREISAKYHIRRVLLFGSSLVDPDKSRDIDIAVEGISPRDFFKYYGELIIRLSKPVDVIDLSSKSKFIDIIEEEGVLLYG